MRKDIYNCAREIDSPGATFGVCEAANPTQTCEVEREIEMREVSHTCLAISHDLAERKPQNQRIPGDKEMRLYPQSIFGD